MTFVPTPWTTPVVSPAATAGSFTRQIPYIAPSEYQFAPTAVSTNALVQGGNSSDSMASTAQVIARASGWIDEHCFHRGDGTLAASVTTESAWVKVKPTGALALICNFKPIVAVVGVGLGPTPSQQTNLSSSYSQNISWDDKVILLPGCWNWENVTPTFGPGWPSVNGAVYVTWQYVNGWPHMALAESASAGDSTITITPSVAGQIFPEGVYANTRLTIRDGSNTEVVFVSATPTDTTLSLSSPLLYSHTPPTAPDMITVSGIPQAIEEACISLTSVLIKAQGSRAMVLGRIGQPATREVASRAGAVEDYDRACSLLKPFQTVYLH